MDVKERPDIVESLNAKAKAENAPSAEFRIIAWTFLFFVFSTSFLFFFMNYKFKKLDDKISLINNKGKH